MEQQITPNQAKVLLQKNTLNMANEVKSGKVLPARVVAMLEAIAAAGEMAERPAGETFVQSQQELADELKLKDRKTIQRWLKDKGNPGKKDDGRYDVMAWREYAKKKGHSFEDEGITQTAAKAEQLLIQNERLKLKLKREKEEVIPKELAQQVFSKLLLTAKTRSYSSVVRLVMIARMAANTQEATEKVKLEIDEIWKSLTDSKWLKS